MQVISFPPLFRSGNAAPNEEGANGFRGSESIGRVFNPRDWLSFSPRQAGTRKETTGKIETEGETTDGENESGARAESESRF
jgi:hypothetical protein